MLSITLNKSRTLSDVTLPSSPSNAIAFAKSSVDNPAACASLSTSLNTCFILSISLTASLPDLPAKLIHSFQYWTLPVEFSIVLDNSSQASSPWFIIDIKPAIASLPAIWVNIEAFCVFVIPSVAFINDFIVAAKSTLPSAVVFKYEPVLSAVRPNCCKAAACSLVGDAILLNTFFSEVPARSPLIPALADNPIAVDKSVILIPNEPANDPTCLSVLPNNSILVLDDVIVAVNLSTNSPVSDADIPIDVKPSVTISLTVPRSVPAILAKLSVSSILASISSVS